MTEPSKKERTIKFRLDEAMHSLISDKAADGFDGNISSFLRCAAVTYSGDTIQSQSTGTDNRIIGLLNSIDKQENRIGVNVNQVVKAINEKIKMSPYAFSASDLSPFSQFCKELKTVQEMYSYIYDILTK